MSDTINDIMTLTFGIGLAIGGVVAVIEAIFWIVTKRASGQKIRTVVWLVGGPALTIFGVYLVIRYLGILS